MEFNTKRRAYKDAEIMLILSFALSLILLKKHR